jgi:hypothetical protein
LQSFAEFERLLVSNGDYLAASQINAATPATMRYQPKGAKP